MKSYIRHTKTHFLTTVTIKRRLIHTMAGKFPYEPTKDQQTAMLDFIYLFARLYPCGDCAKHFKQILEANPPNVTNRESISQWTCKVHNIVNEKLKKPIFDCSKVGEMWKCGCAEDELEGKNTNGTASNVASSVDIAKGDDGTMVGPIPDKFKVSIIREKDDSNHEKDKQKSE